MKKLTCSILALTLVAFSADAAFAAKQKKGKQTPEKRFALLDTNKDQAVSREEFLAKRKDDAAKQKAEKQFKRLDKDGNGSLNLEEFKTPPKKKKA
jgi:Ca2+-binding EF-hand superfamily protein